MHLLRTVCDLEAGVELHVGYLKEPLAPERERAAILMDGYDFECACTACIDQRNPGNLGRSDAARLHVQTLKDSPNAVIAKRYLDIAHHKAPGSDHHNTSVQALKVHLRKIVTEGQASMKTAHLYEHMAKCWLASALIESLLLALSDHADTAPIRELVRLAVDRNRIETGAVDKAPHANQEDYDLLGAMLHHDGKRQQILSAVKTYCEHKSAEAK